MRFTGERVVPTDMYKKADVYSEHLIRYAFAVIFCANKSVLDVACGTGYGTKMLASVAKHIDGGDNDKLSLKYARKHYGLNLKHIDLDSQPIKYIFQRKFDVIVSFETIEHLNHPITFLKNVKEALNENGTFILSIPVMNRSSYHRQLYSYMQAKKVGLGLFKDVKTYIQTSDLFAREKLLSGDFNRPGVYIIKVMKNGH